MSVSIPRHFSEHGQKGPQVENLALYLSVPLWEMNTDLYIASYVESYLESYIASYIEISGNGSLCHRSHGNEVVLKT